MTSVCGICYEELGSAKDAGEIDSCNHVFCFDCISEWAGVENRCPFCKFRFTTLRRKRIAGSKEALVETLQIPERNQRPDDNQGSIYDETLCYFCSDGGDEGNLIVCDREGCFNGAHVYCLGLEEVPEGEWFCDACRTAGWVLPSPAASPLTSELGSEEAAASPALDSNPSTTPTPTPRPARRRLRRVRGSAVERSGGSGGASGLADSDIEDWESPPTEARQNGNARARRGRAAAGSESTRFASFAAHRRAAARGDAQRGRRGAFEPGTAAQHLDALTARADARTAGQAASRDQGRVEQLRQQWEDMRRGTRAFSRSAPPSPPACRLPPSAGASSSAGAGSGSRGRPALVNGGTPADALDASWAALEALRGRSQRECRGGNVDGHEGPRGGPAGSAARAGGAPRVSLRPAPGGRQAAVATRAQGGLGGANPITSHQGLPGPRREGSVVPRPTANGGPQHTPWTARTQSQPGCVAAAQGGVPGTGVGHFSTAQAALLGQRDWRIRGGGSRGEPSGRAAPQAAGPLERDAKRPRSDTEPATGSRGDAGWAALKAGLQRPEAKPWLNRQGDAGAAASRPGPQQPEVEPWLARRGAANAAFLKAGPERLEAGARLDNPRDADAATLIASVEHLEAGPNRARQGNFGAADMAAAEPRVSGKGSAGAGGGAAKHSRLGDAGAAGMSSAPQNRQQQQTGTGLPWRFQSDSRAASTAAAAVGGMRQPGRTVSPWFQPNGQLGAQVGPPNAAVGHAEPQGRPQMASLAALQAPKGGRDYWARHGLPPPPALHGALPGPAGLVAAPGGRPDPTEYQAAPGGQPGSTGSAVAPGGQPPQAAATAAGGASVSEGASASPLSQAPPRTDGSLPPSRASEPYPDPSPRAVRTAAQPCGTPSVGAVGRWSEGDTQAHGPDAGVTGAGDPDDSSEALRVWNKADAAAAVKAQLKPLLAAGSLSRDRFKAVARAATHALVQRAYAATDTRARSAAVAKEVDAALQSA